jgi:hypothetical protein
MARAFQCDKCGHFYLDEPNEIRIKDSLNALVLQKDICDTCKEEIEGFFREDRNPWREL